MPSEGRLRDNLRVRFKLGDNDPELDRLVTVWAAAEQQTRHRLRFLLDYQDDDPELDRAVAEHVADPTHWVNAGVAKPGLCRRSYPSSLLKKAMPELLRDKNCADTLLTDKPARPSKHLCFDTAVESVRLYARLRYPPRNRAQELWVDEWPFPVGEESMRQCAQRKELNMEDLPPAPDQDNPEASIGLWIERKYPPDTRLTLVGYAVRVWLSRRHWRWGLGRALVTIRHSSRVGDSMHQPIAPDGPRIDHHTPEPVDHKEEGRELNAVTSHAKGFLKWYERAVLHLNTELRGRPEGKPSKQLAAARDHYSDAVADMWRHLDIGARDRERKSKPPKGTARPTEPRPADLLKAYERLYASERMAVSISPETYYGWFRPDPPLLQWPPPRPDSE